VKNVSGTAEKVNLKRINGVDECICNPKPPEEVVGHM
jgi:hypothetical protein